MATISVAHRRWQVPADVSFSDQLPQVATTTEEAKVVELLDNRDIQDI